MTLCEFVLLIVVIAFGVSCIVIKRQADQIAELKKRLP